MTTQEMIEFLENLKKWVKPYSIIRINTIIDYLKEKSADSSQWHDLIKNPNDLPSDNREVLVICEARINQCIYMLGVYDDAWEISGIDLKWWEVIKWCEIPKEDEE